jgi:hypothetical protein
LKAYQDSLLRIALSLYKGLGGLGEMVAVVAFLVWHFGTILSLENPYTKP